jgi:hypothetical protein
MPDDYATVARAMITLGNYLVWSKNSNAPCLRSLRSHHRPLLILHSTAL